MPREANFGSRMTAGGEGQGRHVPNRTTDGKKGPTGSQGGDYSLQNIIDLNSLSYIMPANASATTQRQYVQNYFDKNNYTGSTSLVCYINSGSAFIDGNNSFLRYTITVNTPTFDGGVGTLSFANGSGANVIRDISIYSRSGLQLEYVREINKIKYYNDRFGKQKGAVESTLSVQGYGHNYTLSPAGGTSYPITVCIPMRDISGVFRGPGKGVLMPSQLVSGLKVQIELESVARALFISIGGLTVGGEAWDGISGLSYSVGDIAIVTDNSILADSVLRQLNQVSANSGLEYYYSTFDTRNQNQPQGSNFLSMESRKAVSRALTALTVIQKDSSTTDSTTYDSFRCEDYDVASYQSRIGSLWFPNQPVNSYQEAFINTIWSYDRWDSDNSTQGIAIGDYKDGGYGALGVTFERSTVLDLSGVPLNNSRTLTQNIEFASSNDAREVTQYMKYVRLARVFLNNVVLRE